MRLTTLRRIHDFAFLVKVADHAEKVVIHSPKNLPLAQSHSIIRQTFDQMKEKEWNEFVEGKGLIFVNNDTYKMTLASPNSSLLSRITASVMPHKIVPSRVEMNLEKLGFFSGVTFDNRTLAVTNITEQSHAIWKSDSSCVCQVQMQESPLFQMHLVIWPQSQCRST